MTDQTLQVLKEMMQQSVDENGVNRFLIQVSSILEYAAKSSPAKTRFYHSVAGEYFLSKSNDRPVVDKPGTDTLKYLGEPLPGGGGYLDLKVNAKELDMKYYLDSDAATISDTLSEIMVTEPDFGFVMIETVTLYQLKNENNNR